MNGSPPKKFIFSTPAQLNKCIIRGKYSHLLVQPDEFFLKSFVIRVDFKRNPSEKIPAPPIINALVSALWNLMRLVSIKYNVLFPRIANLAITAVSKI